jgi:hypothetical protein
MVLSDPKEMRRLSELYKAFGVCLLLTGPGLAWLNPYIGLPFLLGGLVFLVSGIERGVRCYLLQQSLREPAKQNCRLQ